MDKWELNVLLQNNKGQCLESLTQHSAVLNEQHPL